MLFNTIDFALFLPLVFFLYWFVAYKNLKFQNALIVVASYVFYGWWDWRFLSLILFSTWIDFTIGIKLSKERNLLKKKILLWMSILGNLGVLGFFKYYDFFLSNFSTVFLFFGEEISASSLNIILPVGISFYTFQTLSYTIDIYKGKLQPTNNFVAFSAFVSFFPQLVAGPIERASNLLPQFYKKRVFEYRKAVDGLKQILWGLIKKTVIADNSAQIANEIFNHSENYSGSTLALGALFFAFQIYGDFSGYSDIAIGTSRLFGFDLKQNFAFPYFSRDIAEFWRRWHISLTTWFRDYLYIPLGGSRAGVWVNVRNIFIVFIVSGFWHGANWTFIIWGALNAVYFLPLLLLNKNRMNLDVVAAGRWFATFQEFYKIGFTFFLTVLAWVFFRANSIEHALSYLSTVFSKTLFSIPYFVGMRTAFYTFILIVVFTIVEWFGRKEQYAIAKLGLTWKKPFRYAIYYLMVAVFFLFTGKPQQFIYFQF